MKNRITPENIEELKKNEIFVIDVVEEASQYKERNVGIDKERSPTSQQEQ